LPERYDIQNIPQPGENLLRVIYYPLLGRTLFPFVSAAEDNGMEDSAFDTNKGTSSLKIGLAPNTTKNGDKVCILLGCRAPVVLRPEGHYHIILGDAYVHGCMHGEAMRGVEAGAEPLEDFFIR
jgi:hypothetical protein